MHGIAQDDAYPSDEPAHSKRSPTAEHKQGLGEVAPQLIAKHEFRASGPQDLPQNNGSVIPQSASQNTARPLIKVEREAVSTLMSFRQVPRQPVTYPPAHHAAATSSFRPLWSTAGPSGGRQDHEGAQLRQDDQHHDLAYLGKHNMPDFRHISQRANEPRDRAGAASTATQRLQHERMAVVQHSVARANASAVPAQVQANRSIEFCQAATFPRGSYAQRADLSHSQRNLLSYQNSLLVDPTRAATALATNHAHQAQSHATATQQYQAAIAALAGQKYGQPRPPTIAGLPTAVQNAYQQPFSGRPDAYMPRPPQFAAAPYSHQQSYIMPHHLQSYALQQPQAGPGPYPTQAQILLHFQRQRRYFDALRQRRAHYAQRVLPRPVANHQLARIGPFYTPLPTFFGAQSLARGRSGRNSATSLPPRNARTARPGAMDSADDAARPSNARSKGPIHPLSDAQAQADHMKRWEKGHFAYWTRHGRLASDSDGDLLARALPDVVLDPKDEEAEGNGGRVGEEE